MPITMQHDGGNTFRLDVSGVLSKSDFDRCQDALAAEMTRRTLQLAPGEVSGFEGWEQTAAWGDLTFYVKHGDSIERIAIVGDERWRDEARMFASADLRRAPVEFFTTNAIADARRWLSG